MRRDRDIPQFSGSVGDRLGPASAEGGGRGRPVEGRRAGERTYIPLDPKDADAAAAALVDAVLKELGIDKQ